MMTMADMHQLSADVVVVGGGLSGVCAALAAARSGADTILIQDRPMLGGNTSSEIRVHAGGADNSGGRPGYRESGIVDEIRLEESARNPQRCAQMWDLVLYEKCYEEDKLTLLLNTTCVAAQTRDNGDGRSLIESIIAHRESTEDHFTIAGKFFIDCTGDGRLAAEAGAEYRVGREGPDEFGEPHAQGPDRETMGASLLWVAENMGTPVPFTPPSFTHKFTEDDLVKRGHASFDHGYWWVEYGGQMDTVKDKEEIRDELLAAMMGVWDHIKNGGQHAAANWALKWFGWVPGHRESRRIIGDHILTENDLMNSVLFEDRVAHGGWPMDTHPPGGIYCDLPPADFLRTPDIYSIPLRALYSKDVANMLMAGRCVSCTHMAMSSTRLAATGAAMGQAVGTAAAMCCVRECLPRDIVASHIGDLQQQLLKDDQYIADLPADDPVDLARRARVQASSELAGFEARKVIDGITRARNGDSHQWASDPVERSGSQIELWLEGPSVISEVHLTFDSGYSRPLTLTESDWFNGKMIRGPQPETVADYTIDIIGEDLAPAHSIPVRNNHLRKRVHHFTPVSASAVVIRVSRTNGDASARIFEVRVYE